jgi:hypothetical protein
MSLNASDLRGDAPYTIFRIQFHQEVHDDILAQDPELARRFAIEAEEKQNRNYDEEVNQESAEYELYLRADVELQERYNQLSAEELESYVFQWKQSQINAWRVYRRSNMLIESSRVKKVQRKKQKMMHCSHKV